MYPTTPNVGGPGSSQAKGPQRSKGRQGSRQPRGRSARPRSSRRGLLAILLVILLVAGAAAVYFLWYVPNQGASKDEADVNARSLVRQAMTAIDKAYVDAQTFDPQALTPNTLKAVASSITFHPMSDTSAATAPNAQAKDNAVNYAGTQTSYAVGTVSESGTTFGAVVDKESDTVTYHIDGQQVAGWDQAATSGTTAITASDTPTTATPATDAPNSQTQTGPISAANDVEAMMLVRNSMTTVESAFADLGTFEPSVMTADLLQQSEPTATFIVRETEEAATAPSGAAETMTIDFYGTATSYALGTTSKSGTTFGVLVNKGSGGRTTVYYVNGQVEDWSTLLPAGIIGALTPHRG
jgi:flagellar basal body-associated protein FliL